MGKGTLLTLGHPLEYEGGELGGQVVGIGCLNGCEWCSELDLC